MLMYSKEANNRKQEIDRQHHTIPNQRANDKHHGNVYNLLFRYGKVRSQNMEKLKTGDVLEVAEVVKNLELSDRERRLSAGEKKMLSNAKQILASEIVLVQGIDIDKAMKVINDAI